MGCCKSRSNGNVTYTDDVEAKGKTKDTPPQKNEDTLQGIENKTCPEQNGHKRTSSKRTNSETENEKSEEVRDDKSHDSQSDSSEMPKENGTLPTERSEVKESNTDEKRMSVIYAKPDKRPTTKNTSNTNDTVPQSSDGDMENGKGSSDLNAAESGSVPRESKSSDHEDSETMPEVLYAKPMRNRDQADKDANDESSTTELENRISFGDDYATIHETLASGGKDTPKEESGDISAYEDVKLGDMSPPSRDDLPRLPSNSDTKPPPLPSDSLTRPPRHPSIEKTQSAERSVLGTPMPEPPDEEVFLPVTGKSSSVRQTASPYAETELVPRSKSAKARFISNRSNAEEPMVELGSPGIIKPSVKVPGSPPAFLDIPDEEDNPDYERVTLPSPSEASQPVIETSRHPGNTTGDEESGWVENTIYSSVDKPNRDAIIEDEESPELVTYEQTNFLGLKNQYTSDLNEEDDYEEIRRSRLAQFEDDEISEQTTSQTIDGKVVPVTEL